MVKERTALRFDEQNKTVTAGIVTSLAVSIFLCSTFFLFKNLVGLVFADSRSELLFYIVLPGVILTSVYAVIRGFFWGKKSFYTYSTIELLEEIVMIAVGVFAISRVDTVMQKAVWASVAVLISYIFSFTLSSITFFFKGGRISNPKNQLKPLIYSSTPITFMRTASSLTSSLIALILPAVLIKAGMNMQQAVSEFGIISGMTMPLLFIPSTIIGSISLVLTPELAESFYKHNSKKLQSEVEKSTLCAILIAVLIIPLFVGMGKYIGTLIYNNPLSGVYLRWASPIMLPMSISMITSSLLNSIGMERKTLLYYLLGSLALLLCVIFLPILIGNYALILGYFLCYLLTAILNVALLKKICCKKLEFIKKTLFCLPICLLCCLLCFFTFELASKFISSFLALIISSLLTLICEIIALAIFKVIDINQIKKVSL